MSVPRAAIDAPLRVIRDDDPIAFVPDKRAGRAPGAGTERVLAKPCVEVGSSAPKLIKLVLVVEGLDDERQAD